MKVKNYLKQARKKKGFSQEKIARLAGIATSSYAEIETGRSVPSVKTAFLLAKVLNTKVDKLFYLTIYEK